MRAIRLGNGPIIGPRSAPGIGANVQGPSLIEVPDWVVEPLGRFYLYFADHKGTYIRLAHADEIEGPWTVHDPGSLHLDESHFLTESPPATPDEIESLRAAFAEVLGPDHLPDELVTDSTTPHIASPDVHVDHVNRRIIMYFHGLDSLALQVTRAAVSSDGVMFRARPEVLGGPYMRAFAWRGRTYALTMPGHFSRSADGLSGFEAGPTLFDRNMRHAALLRRGDSLLVFWTRVGDAPERILCSTIDVGGDWSDWSVSDAVEVLRPEFAWEGADAPALPSKRSVAHGHVNQLRDPAILQHDGRVIMAYAAAGESGIALAEIEI